MSLRRQSFSNQPQRLCGREKERALLQELAAQVQTGELPSQTVFVHGHSGTGKTFFCLQAVTPLLRSRPKDAKHSPFFFLRGKFDQFYNHSVPCDALVQALDQLMAKAAATATHQSALTNHIQACLENEAAVLREVVPSFRQKMGEKDQQQHLQAALPPDGAESKTYSDENSGEMTLASERLVVAFLSFLRAFCTSQYPVILLIDDLQWADPDSIAVLQALVEESSRLHYLLLLGIYRDEADLSDLAPIMETTKKHYAKNFRDMALANLDSRELKALIVDLLTITDDNSKIDDMVSLVHRKTNGNPLFAKQFLAMLKEKELMKFNFGTMQWQWDIDAVAKDTSLTDNVAAVLSNRVKLLNPNMIKAFQIAACLGFVFDAFLLEQLLTNLSIFVNFDNEETNDEETKVFEEKQGTEQIMSSFDRIMQEGVDENYIETTGDHYRFTHDTLQEAFYNTMPEDRRTRLHWEIGKFIHASIASGDEKLKRFYMLGTDQMNHDPSLVSNDEERILLIHRNHEASLIAKKRNGLPLVGIFLDAASKLIRDTDWVSNYRLLFSLRTLQAEYEESQGHHAEGIAHCNEIIRHARNSQDTIAALVTRARIHYSQFYFSESVKDARQALVLCEERLPRSNIFNLLVEMRKIKGEIKGKSDRDLTNLPTIHDERKILALKTLLHTAILGWTCDPILMVLCYIRMLRITLRCGSSHYLPATYAAFSSIVADGFGDTQLAARFAEIALRYGAGSKLPGTICFAYGLCLHCKMPVASMLSYLLSGYRKGLECGDTIFGSICLGLYADAYKSAGLRLNTYASDLHKFAVQLKIMKLDVLLGFLLPNLQLALNLTGISDDNVTISWSAIAKHEYFSSSATPELPLPAQISLGYNQLLNAYIMRDRNVAEATFARLRSIPEKNRRFQGSHFLNYFFKLMDGIVGMWLDKIKNTRRNRRIVHAALKWFKQTPNLNSAPLLSLLEAQYAWYKNTKSTSKSDIMQMYNMVIPLLVRSGQNHYAAIANEQLAEYLLNMGDEESAMEYIERSLEMYAQWEAVVKVQALVKTYPQFESIKIAYKGSSIKGREQFSPNADAATVKVQEGGLIET